MSSAALVWARPSQTVRRSRKVPLSRLSGATLASAVICLCLFWGQRSQFRQTASRVVVRTGPMPGVAAQQRVLLEPDRALQNGFGEVGVGLVQRRSSQAICARRFFRMACRARVGRFFSAVSMSMSDRRRVTKAARACVCSSGSGRGSGRIPSANRANIWVSMASVLANCPVALAKSRNCAY
jgi:hypothetical protein